MNPRILLLIAILLSVVRAEGGEEPGECVGGVCGGERAPPKRVAIIGGGIAGSSAAYYISQLIPDVEITLYEKDTQPCGRLTDTSIHGQHVEVGGSIYHESNHNIDGFVKQFNLTKQSPLGGATVGIWNGHEFIFTPSNIPIFGEFFDIVKMFYRYGMSPYNLKSFLNSLMSNWSRLYDFEEPSETMEDFFTRLDLHDETISLGVEHLESVGISREFIHDMLGPMTRVNYNTAVEDMNTFGVAVSAIGSGSSIFGVQEGNRQICANLVQHSKAHSHYGSTVTSITKDADAPGTKYTVQTDKDKETFDAVVIATPLELSNLKFKNVEVDDFVFKAREYRLVHVTFVAGVLNPEYFHVDPVPTVVLTVENASVPFSSIGRSKNITTPDGLPVSKIFSREALSEDLLSQIFVNHSVVHNTQIYAYPILRPPTKFVPVQLAKDLFYVNSMETIVSTMETETISAKNIARLLAKNWGLPYAKKL